MNKENETRSLQELIEEAERKRKKEIEEKRDTLLMIDSVGKVLDSVTNRLKR